MASKGFYPLLLVALFFGLAEPASACSSSCGGCVTTMIKSRKADPSGTWLKFYNALRAKGVTPISCYRSQKCQDQLRRTCGARAAKVSNHTNRVAMDFRTSNGDHQRARAIASKILKGSVRELTHGGGGYHMSNGAGEGRAYRASSTKVAAYRAEKQKSGGTQKGLVRRPGHKGQWLRRRSGEWVRMTLN
jgi:hypothetical protein